MIRLNLIEKRGHHDLAGRKFDRAEVMQRLGIGKTALGDAVRSGELVAEYNTAEMVAGKPKPYFTLSALGRYLGLDAYQLLSALEILPSVSEPPVPVSEPLRGEVPRDVLGNVIPDIGAPGAFDPQESSYEEFRDSFGHKIYGGEGHRMFAHVEPIRGETQSHMDARVNASHEGPSGNDNPLFAVKGYEPGSEAYERDIAKWTLEHGSRNLGSQRALAMAAERARGINRMWPRGTFCNPMSARAQRSNGQLDAVRGDGATSGHTIQPTAQDEHSQLHPERYAHLKRITSK